MEGVPTMFAEHLAPEDQARADFYALLSRLFAQAPDATLLTTIAGAPPLATADQGVSEASVALATSWTALVSASAQADAQAVADEYQTLFVGVGRSEVSLHGSAYVKAKNGGPLLVQVRASLDQLHLARQPGVTMFEDHIAAVFETMRVIIGGDGRADGFAFDVQREFFGSNVEPWAQSCCNAICKKAVAMYYGRAAQFAHDFMAIERDSFSIES
jgi:TorA maturation chaperone TorD